MNRIHRIVFNHSLGLWQVVAETARGRGKTKAVQRVPLARRMQSAPLFSRALALAVLMALGVPAQAAESGDTGGNLNGACAVAPAGSYIGACLAGPGTAWGGDVAIVDDHPFLSGALIAGGYADSGSATDNRVTVSGGTLGVPVYGGYAANPLFGAAMRNTVTMTGGTAPTVGLEGGYAEGASAMENTVVFGGDASIYKVYGGHAKNNAANRNTVTIRGGLVRGDVYGGYGWWADGNTVRIEGGTIQGYVYGGYAGSNNDPAMVRSASNNRVILAGSADLSASILYGGRVDTQPGSTITGNVLEVRTTGLTVKNINGFQELHFVLPADVTPGTTALTLTTGTGVLGGVKVGVALASGGNVLRTGDRVTLIHANAGWYTVDETVERVSIEGYQGVSLGYTFDVSTDEHNLYATVASGEPGSSGEGATVLEQTKAPVEGRANTMAMTTQAGDLTAGEGMARALGATDGVSGTATFGATAGGTSRYHSGSHVDTTGLSIMVGAAKRFPLAQGQWLAGVFVEGGYGSYDTYNDIAGQPTVHGSGKSRYFGGGALVRRDWAADGEAGPYVEGSVRLGRASSDWGSNTMRGAADASYDTASMYYGAHAGVGYILPLNEKTSVDAHVKGFWTHQEGDSVTIAGDPFEFKAMDSFRSRLGLRLNRVVTEQITAYVGAAWEHEFDGQARATTYGLDTPSPSLKGDTGVFELGFDMKPKADGPLTVGLGVQGYTGMREGFGGTAKMMWVF